MNMKKLLMCLTVFTALISCEDKTTNKYIGCFPVYEDYETFRQPAQFLSPQIISDNGHIYIKDEFLYIVDPDKGVHFINNSNPSSPTNIGYLSLKGCTGISISDNYLFANSFIDLVVFDITNKTNPIEISRMKDIFPDALPVMEKNYPVGEGVDKSKGVVVAWEYRKVKEEVENSSPMWINCPNCDVMTIQSFSESSSGSSPAVGISGSITKSLIMGDYLYIMHNSNLIPISIANPYAPVAKTPVPTWRQVETLFPHENYIFMGTTTGMLIYSTVNPEEPVYISSVDHMTACDPVVVQGNYCYVTVRSGTTCGGDLNQLDVIDISDIYYPILKSSFEMKNPHGLGIDGNLLFICDGSDGLKIFDATNPESAGNNLLHRFKDIEATDVIPHNNLAIVIGENGIRQYDYTDASNLILLSEFNF